MSGLSLETLEKAKRELSENPDRRDKDIQALRDMVLANPSLKCPTDDAFLLRFLRGRKFNYDRAYNLITEYYTVRAENKSIFQACLPSKSQTVFDSRVSMILPNKDKEGRRILYFRPACWDPKKFPMMDILKINVMQLEKIILEEETQVHGVVMIGDMKGLTMQHVKHFDRDYGKLMSSLLQDAFPLRMKGLYMCNEPGVFSYIWAIMKNFIKEKLSKRISFNGEDLTKLHKEIGIENLPKELGGSAGSADDIADAWYDVLKKDEEYYQSLLQNKIELSRAISKKRNDEVVDSLIGTYKKLNVD